jgi:hypothetical protein
MSSVCVVCFSACGFFEPFFPALPAEMFTKIGVWYFTREALILSSFVLFCLRRVATYKWMMASTASASFTSSTHVK